MAETIHRFVPDGASVAITPELLPEELDPRRLAS
jgi:hypothetical protein